MIDSPRFISVRDLLTDIGGGIGMANAAMSLRAATEIGTLVVKSADIEVSMELTSHAQSSRTSVGADLPVLGAKTLSFGSDTLKESSVNRLQIKLQVVAVQPPAKAAETADAGKPLDAAEALSAVGGAANFRRVLDQLSGQLGRNGMPAGKRALIDDEIGSARALLNGGDIARARSATVDLLRRYGPAT